MNILMMTNTYKPILGGLEKSVEAFSSELRAQGHKVMILAPEYEGMQPEEGVLRIPAMQKFNGSDFSVQVPLPGVVEEALSGFKPDIVHAHHPFLIGDTALRVASKYNVPLVFTHHTLYEQNVHYVPGNADSMKKFVIELSTGYANLADYVIAPSESVLKMIKERGVTTSVQVVPTGIYVEKFARGAPKAFRKKFNIPADAFVVGHLGRLAPEKNLEFVAAAVAQFMKYDQEVHFMIAGKGPSEDAIKQICQEQGVQDRLHLIGSVQGKDLIDAYHAMDVFAFASQSETQGLVLTEAMAAGIPVVAVDAPGAREVVKDQINGRLLPQEEAILFLKALEWVRKQPAAKIKKMKAACRQTAQEFSMENSIKKILDVYFACVVEGFVRKSKDDQHNPLDPVLRMIQAQWGLVTNLTKAATAAIIAPYQPEALNNRLADALVV